MSELLSHYFHIYLKLDVIKKKKIILFGFHENTLICDGTTRKLEGGGSDAQLL